MLNKYMCNIPTQSLTIAIGVNIAIAVMRGQDILETLLISTLNLGKNISNYLNLIIYELKS